MNRIRQLAIPVCVLVASLFGAALVEAKPVSDLYRAQVPVTNQGDAERNRALREGLGKVLVKVTGNSAVLSRPDIAELLSQASSLVTEYGYVELPPPGGDGEPGTAMSVHYSAAAVDRLVRQKQLQIWPADRPELLVWMVVDTPAGGKQFVSSEEQIELLSLLSRAMRERGAPLLVPLLDLGDRARLGEADVWNFNAEKLAEAAERYSSPTWMAVRLYQSSTGKWRGARLLQTEGGNTLESLVADSAPQLIDGLVAEAIDRLASEYAFTPQSTAQQLILNIEGVDTYQAFNEITDYLMSLELVSKLVVDYVDGERLGLSLSVEGDIPLLLDALRRDSRLDEQPVGDFPDAAISAYLFRWNDR